MSRLSTLAFALLVLIGCSDDKPTAPGDDLIGAWVIQTTSNANDDELRFSEIQYASDGTFSWEFADDGVLLTLSGTWEDVDGVLIWLFRVDGELTAARFTYTVRDSRLTMVNESDGDVWVLSRSS